jgi:hypothetical protein
MQDMQGHTIEGQSAPRTAPPRAEDRPSLAAPLIFLVFVGVATLILLYVGERQFVVPMLFLSLPLATIWLIVIDRRRRD